jgi:hypothetical protein
MIIDPANSRLLLLDLERQIQTEVTSKKLDETVGRSHDSTRALVERQEKSKTRAERIAAAMSRDLIDPQFEAKFDPNSRRLRLTNASVEVEALGEPEPDHARLNVIVNCLAAVAKLSTLRDPENLPPFVRLEALRTMTAEHQLRPTEMSFIFRLSGPPKKLRWTYRVVPELSAREREALERIDQMRSAARFVRYEKYEQHAK